MANTIEHEIPPVVQGLVGKEGGKDSTFFAILGIEGTGETSYWPAVDDDGTELSPSGPKGLDYYLAHKVERKRMTIRLVVSGNAVSAESFVRAETGMMASAIGPNTVDVYPEQCAAPEESAAATLGRKGGKAGTPAQNRARAKNAKKGGWPKGRPRKPQTPEA